MFKNTILVGVLESSGEKRKNRFTMLGALVQTAYRIDKTWELSARYAVVDLTDDLIADTQLLMSSAPQAKRHQEGTIGINYYISGHSLKWQNDAGLIRSTCRCGHQTQYRIRSQLQLAF